MVSRKAAGLAAPSVVRQSAGYRMHGEPRIVGVVRIAVGAELHRWVIIGDGLMSG